MVSLSMRRLIARRQRCSTRDESRKSRSEHILSLLRRSYSISTASDNSGDLHTTCSRIAQALKNVDEAKLHKFLNTAENRAGRKAIITYAELSIIKNQIIYAASLCFAIDTQKLQAMFAKFASDDHTSYKPKYGLPSLDTI